MRRGTEDCQKRKSKEEKGLSPSSTFENEIDVADSDIEVDKKYLSAAVSVGGKLTTPKQNRAKLLDNKLPDSLELNLVIKKLHLC